MAPLAFSHHTGGLAARAGVTVDRDQIRQTACRAAASRRCHSSQGAASGAPSRLQRPPQRRLDVTCAASSSGSSSTGATSDYAALQGRAVYSAASGSEVQLPSLWRAEPGKRCVVVFLTHFADLSSTELAQKLKAVLPEVRRVWGAEWVSGWMCWLDAAGCAARDAVRLALLAKQLEGAAMQQVMA